MDANHFAPVLQIRTAAMDTDSRKRCPYLAYFFVQRFRRYLQREVFYPVGKSKCSLKLYYYIG